MIGGDPPHPRGLRGCWHVGNGFSQHKRCHGSALIARNAAFQNRELVLRILTHNLMLLAETA